MSDNAVQIKVKVPNHLNYALEKEAKSAGVTKASLVKLAVNDRYPNALEEMQADLSEKTDQEGT